MDDISLDSVTYGTTGWNALVQSNFEEITTYINEKLNHDNIVFMENVAVCFDNKIVTMEGD